MQATAPDSLVVLTPATSAATNAIHLMSPGA